MDRTAFLAFERAAGVAAGILSALISLWRFLSASAASVFARSSAILASAV